MNKEALEQLREIGKELKMLNAKMDIIIPLLKNHQSSDEPRSMWAKDDKNSPLDVEALLTLSDHLRKTAMVMLELQEATADMVAEKTGRQRATESDCLNQLVRMGYLKKKRDGLKAVFHFKNNRGDK